MVRAGRLVGADAQRAVRRTFRLEAMELKSGRRRAVAFTREALPPMEELAAAVEAEPNAAS